MYFLQKEKTRKSRQHYILLYNQKTRITKATHHINLLKIEDEEHDTFHYVYLSKVIAGLWEDRLPKEKIKFIPVIIA